MTATHSDSVRLRGAAAWGAGIALALLMIVTRGHHAASIGVLPSASWAVFFLAGLWLRPWWGFAALFALSTALDFGLLNGGQVDPWCVSPSYWVLLPAYASLWLAGRVLAHWLGQVRAESALAVRLLVSVALGALGALVCAAVALLAYVLSGGGFYFLSGRYAEPSLAGFALRIAHYYPQRLGVLAGYVGAGVAALSMLRLALARDPSGEAAA